MCFVDCVVHLSDFVRRLTILSTLAFIICILHFCHTCSLCHVDLVVQFPARGSTQVMLCLFPGVLWLWHFLYSIGPHTVSSLNIYTFVVSRAFIADVASQAGNADSSGAPGLISGLQGSVNVHRSVLLLVPQRQCISSFVFYIYHVCNFFNAGQQVLAFAAWRKRSLQCIYRGYGAYFSSSSGHISMSWSPTYHESAQRNCLNLIGVYFLWYDFIY